MKIPYFRFKPAGNELKYFKEVLESGWLTSSSKAIKLEESFKEKLGVAYALSVNSCTSALHLALEALEVNKDSNILLPTWTFAATAEVVEYLNANPIFCDVDIESCNITPKILQDVLDKGIKIDVLLLVHFGGRSAILHNEQKEGLIDLCIKNNIKIVHDAAHAFPASFKGRMVGSFSDITCFSFYANKTITSGEGGMVVTDDEEFFKRMKLMRLHGIDRDAWDRFTSVSNKNEYDIVDAGFKYNMPDINAAIALAQFEKADELKEKRISIAQRYLSEFRSIESLTMPSCNGDISEHSWHLFNPVLKRNKFISREDILNKLQEKGIGTSLHYKPLHRMTFYREKYNLSKNDFPNSEEIWAGCFSLPIFPDLQEEEQSYIIDAVKEILS
ncbi:DegT/DnrJ/EryC1/StrS family aminotransferase [Gammaproteobacteria bacterium]|nr:DegT/DnrJ/EryC1/StrS family aminotransferase [Gammaproteobacteria bacterium]